MPVRPQERRPKDFKPGEVTGWRPGVDRAPLVDRAHYIPDGKHKSYPAPNGEWTLCTRPEGTRCPRIPPEKWRHLQTYLRSAMAAGVVQFHPEDDSDFPARVWSYIDDRLYEARRSNAASGGYHAFPLDYEDHHPRDPHGLLARAPRGCL